MNKFSTKKVLIYIFIVFVLIPTFGLCLEPLAYSVMAAVTHVYDEQLNASYDKASVRMEEGLSYEKASLGRACEINPDKKTVNESSCINAIILTGSVGTGMEQSFNKLLSSTPELPDTICFSSGGGITSSAEKIAITIRDRAFNTCMADYLELENGLTNKSPSCKSSCPFMLLAGHRRIALGNSFTIGVHHTGMWMNLPVMGKFAKHTPILEMILWPPLYPIIEGSAMVDKEKHKALFDRSNLTNLEDIDIIEIENYPKYAIFNVDDQ